MTFALLAKEWFIFAISLLLFTILIIFFPPTHMTLTSGDEPHYLIEAHSLYYDHDFDVRNNYQNKDYLNFYNYEPFPPHVQNFKGRILPYHFVLGLPLLIALPYGLAGRIGVLIFLSTLMASALVLLYRVVCVYVTKPVAGATVLFCGLTYPLVIYSQEIYPETIAFMLVVFSLALSMLPTRSMHLRAGLVGSVLGLLPHFHVKFALLSVTLYLFFLWKNRAQWRLALQWSIIPAILLALAFFAWTYHIYGEISLAVFLSPFPGAFGDGRFNGIAGLYFDQEYGLFFFAPFYLLTAVGVWRVWQERAKRVDVLFLLFIYASYHVLCGSYYDWRGGLSPAPRYLLPVLPILIIFTAQGVAVMFAQRQWSQLVGLALATLWITQLILFVNRALMFGFDRGSNTILREQYHLGWLIALLPSFRHDALAGAYVRLAVFLLMIIGLWYIGSWVNRRLWVK